MCGRNPMTKLLSTSAPIKRPRRVRSLAVVLALVGALAAPVLAAGPAQAYSTTCTNYGCPDSGAWDSARWTSWWGNHVTGTSTPGANCTNYAAWKLIRNGANGPMYLGNANTWDDRARSWGYAVDRTPAVGAIAQWNYGEFGHVAYVEAVNGNTITISESNFSGAWLRWRTMDISEIEWFIHIKDVSAPPPAGPTMVSRFALGTPDFNGDGRNDFFRVSSDGRLFLYPGNGSGGWANGAGIEIGTGWTAFNKLVAPGDFSGDGKADLIGIMPDGTMKLYTGNGTGGWANQAGTTIGSGFIHPTVLSPGDFNGDARADIITVNSAGDMHLYTGNGSGGWRNATGTLIGTGWSALTKIFSPGDFNGDGKTDVMGVDSNGNLKLYTGNGVGSWANASGVVVGTGFNRFQVATSARDFTGDGKTDVIGFQPDGAMYLYRGNGSGGWVTGNGEVIGSGW